MRTQENEAKRGRETREKVFQKEKKNLIKRLGHGDAWESQFRLSV